MTIFEKVSNQSNKGNKFLEFKVRIHHFIYIMAHRLKKKKKKRLNNDNTNITDNLWSVNRWSECLQNFLIDSHKFTFILSYWNIRLINRTIPQLTMKTPETLYRCFSAVFLFTLDTLPRLTSNYPVFLHTNLNIFSYARFWWVQLSLSPSFSEYQNHIQHPVEHLKWIILQKQLMVLNRQLFSENIHLRYLAVFE